MRKRKRLFTSMLLCLFLLAAPFTAGAQDYPARQVTLIAPFQAGGAADAACRLLAEVGQKYLGQPIVVEVKLGAAGQIAADYLSRQKPDGYTMGALFYSQTHGEHFKHFREATSTSKDFRAVAQFTSHYYAVIVRADDPLNNLKDLVDYVKKNPELPYGPGSSRRRPFI